MKPTRLVVIWSSRMRGSLPRMKSNGRVGCAGRHARSSSHAGLEVCLRKRCHGSVRLSDSEAKGHRFESCRVHQPSMVGFVGRVSLTIISKSNGDTSHEHVSAGARWKRSPHQADNLIAPAVNPYFKRARPRNKVCGGATKIERENERAGLDICYRE